MNLLVRVVTVALSFSLLLAPEAPWAQTESVSTSGAGTISAPSPSFFDLLRQRIEVNTCVRVSTLHSESFDLPGRKLTEWADYQLTLFDPSYIEPTIRYRHGQKFLFVAQAGISNRLGQPFLPTESNEELTATKELYSEIYGLGGGENSAWIGRRKFRIVDEHDIVGAGFKMKVAEDLKAGISYGMRRDFGYWGLQQNGQPVEAEFETPYRRLVALDFEKTVGESANIQMLLEYQRMDATAASFPGASGQRENYDLPALDGFLLGAEGNRWSQDWNISTALTYSYGEVGGTPFAKFNTRGSPAVLMGTAGQSPLVVQNFKKDNQRVTLTHYGAGRIARASYAFLVAGSYDAFADGNVRAMNLLQARPFYHLTNRFHLGADVSRTTMIKGYEQPSATVVAPTLKYAFWPERGYTGNQLQLFYAMAFYDDEYEIYGQPRRFAGTVGAQVEAYF